MKKKIKNKIIGVDLDEVLAELLDYILEYNNYKIGNKTIVKDDIKDYYIHKIDNLNITADEAIEWFRKPMLEDIKNFKVPALIGSKEKLLDLKKQGYKFIIVTARIESIFGEYTRKWVENHFKNIFDNIIFTDHFTDNHKNKSEVCLEYGISYFIEDNYDYAMDIAKAGIKVYLLEKPWNNHQKEYHENIIRIKSWEEFMK